ncbi:MAG: hypothetical protein AAGG38_10185 [Planctomycetota bacterium]
MATQLLYSQFPDTAALIFVNRRTQSASDRSKIGRSQQACVAGVLGNLMVYTCSQLLAFTRRADVYKHIDKGTGKTSVPQMDRRTFLIMPKASNRGFTGVFSIANIKPVINSAARIFEASR